MSGLRSTNDLHNIMSTLADVHGMAEPPTVLQHCERRYENCNLAIRFMKVEISLVGSGVRELDPEYSSGCSLLVDDQQNTRGSAGCAI